MSAALPSDPSTRALLIAANNATGALEGVRDLLKLVGMDGSAALVQNVASDLRACVQAVLFTNVPTGSSQ